MRAEASTKEALDKRRERERRATRREAACFRETAAWRRRKDACLAGTFAGNAPTAGTSASKKPRQSRRIGSDARCIQNILILLAARGAKPAAN